MDSKQAILSAVDKSINEIISSIDSCVDPNTERPFEADEKRAFINDINGFKEVFAAFLKQRGKVIDWSLINPPPKHMIVPYAELKDCKDTKKQEILSKLVVLKLNGGLGTTMGCVGPKSAIEVHSKYTFLDLTVQQIEVILSLSLAFSI